MPMKVYFGVRRQTRLFQGENTEMQDFTILPKPAQRWCTNKLHSEMSKSLYTQRYQTLDLKIFRLNFRAKQGKQFGLMTSVQFLTSALFEKKKGQMWLLMWH